MSDPQKPATSMTLREHYIGLAMQSLATDERPAEAARLAAEYADAILGVLKQDLSPEQKQMVESEKRRSEVRKESAKKS